ncbi:MAG: ABC-type transport system involved in cytochrome c biosis, permease component, partial [Actinomycetia bacterium]|nr:ABC-type transport system involved in cytochrome c biosis, permease component [Actinomycetes bacterium]
MKRLLLAATLASLSVTLVFALWVTPQRPNQGFDAVRLLYLHVPTAWIAYLAFGVTALASVLWLVPRTRDTAWDLLAGASAEVG